MHKALIAALLSLSWSAAAQADDYDDFGERRGGGLPGMAMAGGGLAAYLGGSAVATFGVLSNSEGAALGGALVSLVGQPMMVAGSMKAARTLQDGGLHVSTVGGVLGWAGLGLEAVGVGAALTGEEAGTTIGAIGSTMFLFGATGQMIVDSAVYHANDGSNGRLSSHTGPARGWVAVAPMADREHVGLAVVGQF